MKDPPGNLRQRLRSPGGIVLLYLLFAAAWIAGSDSALRFLFGDPDQLTRIGTMKGMLFVGITSGLLFLLLSAWHTSLVRANQASDLYRDRLERVLRGTNDGWWEWNLADGQSIFRRAAGTCSAVALIPPRATLPSGAGSCIRTTWRPPDAASRN